MVNEADFSTEYSAVNYIQNTTIHKNSQNVKARRL